MKKLFILLVLWSVLLRGYSQRNWYVSLSTGYGFSGPQPAIRDNMVASGLNQHSPDSWFGPGRQYPRILPALPALLTIGKKLKEGRSLYLEGGISNAGTVIGYQAIGMGNWMHIKYRVYQATAGVLYSFPKARLGAGPSLFVLHYEEGTLHKNKYASFVPGLSLAARLPLGKEKKMVGVDLVADVNLAPPARTKELVVRHTLGTEVYTTTLKADKVSMIHGMVGLALSVRD